MKTDKLFRYAVSGLVLGIFAIFCAVITERYVFASNQAAVQTDDLSGNQQPQVQAQPSEANPMQEPEQIEEPQRVEQADEAPPQQNEPDEIEQVEAPPLNQ